MSDTALPVIFRFDTTANRMAFTPTPGVSEQLYIWEDSDDQPNAYYWDGATWQLFNGGGSGGNVTTGTALTAGKTIIGNGTVDVTISSLTAQFVGSSSGTEAAASMSTGKLLGRTTAGSGAVEEITVGNGLSFSSTTLTGKVAQVVTLNSTGAATGTGRIPFDDSIPQNTEGDEYMTLAITPKNASSTLVINVVIMGSSSSSSNNNFALFQDTTADALAAAFMSVVNVAGTVMVGSLTHTMIAGTTSAITFKVRASTNSGTFTFNGFGGGRAFGAITKSSIVITEYLP